jgi:hypothetical protein
VCSAEAIWCRPIAPGIYGKDHLVHCAHPFEILQVSCTLADGDGLTKEDVSEGKLS